MKISKGKLLFVLLLVSTLIVGNGYIQAPKPLALHVLDVGQGDSILIVTPNDQRILIDGGEVEYGDKVVEYLKGNGIKRIDLLVGTHPHSDHIGGLAEVMANFEVGEFFMPLTTHNSVAFEEVLKAAEKQDLKITAGRAGHAVEIGKDLSLHLLGPLKDYGDQLNNWSIVLKLDYKEKSFMFMGDAEASLEKDLLSAYSPQQLKSHFIKIGHHGSDTSTSENFLEAVAPHIAVISVGEDNSYGHPHKTILQRIKDKQIRLYRTDLQEDVIFYSDGKRIWSTTPPLL